VNNKNDNEISKRKAVIKYTKPNMVIRKVAHSFFIDNSIANICSQFQQICLQKVWKILHLLKGEAFIALHRSPITVIRNLPHL
jgi:hypothetical protein